MMSSLETRLEQVLEKLEKHSKVHQLQAAEIEILQRDLKQSRETIALQKNTIRSLEEKNKIVKIAEAVALSKEDKRVVKLKINEFIREIDKCIATLSE